VTWAEYYERYDGWQESIRIASASIRHRTGWSPSDDREWCFPCQGCKPSMESIDFMFSCNLCQLS
jgi:hypothetical protein